MELKYLLKRAKDKSAACSNRTFMELKYFRGKQITTRQMF